MANSTPKAAPKGAKTAPPPAPATETAAVKAPNAMTSPRYSTWQIVGIVAGVLAIAAVACAAGAAVGFGYGRASARLAVSAAGLRNFMAPGAMDPFGGGMMPYGFDDELPYGMVPGGMMGPRLAGGAYLGVTYQAVGEELATQEGLAAGEGALVSSIVDGSPAAEAGLQAGDILLAVDGKPIVRSEMLRRLILSHAPGDTIALLVLRDGAKETIEVTLGEKPDSPAP